MFKVIKIIVLYMYTLYSTKPIGTGISAEVNSRILVFI